MESIGIQGLSHVRGTSVGDSAQLGWKLAWPPLVLSWKAGVKLTIVWVRVTITHADEFELHVRVQERAIRRWLLLPEDQCRRWNWWGASPPLSSIELPFAK